VIGGSGWRPVISSGIGGTAALLDIEGTPVFVKRVPLTDPERRPENVMSTANPFRLPTCCHYGVGSAGGGGWREVAADLERMVAGHEPANVPPSAAPIISR
jgi:hypothetical protein